MIDDPDRGGWGLDGVWADDFHHVVRSLLAGDDHGYYSDFRGTSCELARAIQHGWLFTGQRSSHLDKPRGTDASHIPMHRFVVCLQNHDQIGNRALGDRLHHAIPPDAWRAASALLLAAPMTPLLFMGQEWAAATPFQYFTDLGEELGHQVTDGRRREFADFPEFSSEEARHRIPDPQAPSTFEASRLRWEERDRPAHQAVLALYRALIALRLDHPELGASDETEGDATAPDADSVVMRRADGDDECWIVVRLRGAGSIDLAPIADAGPNRDRRWQVLLTTEEPLFALDPRPPHIDHAPGGPVIRFERPGAVILKK
jgi:maltooligosyltrehalose trehalohydrolase